MAKCADSGHRPGFSLHGSTHSPWTFLYPPVGYLCFLPLPALGRPKEIMHIPAGGTVSAHAEHSENVYGTGVAKMTRALQTHSLPLSIDLRNFRPGLSRSCVPGEWQLL